MKYIGVIYENSHMEVEGEDETMKYFTVKNYYEEIFLHYAELELFAENKSLLNLSKRKEIPEMLDKYNFQAASHRDAECFILDIMTALNVIDIIMVTAKFGIRSNIPEFETELKPDDLNISFDIESLAKRRNIKKPMEIKF